MIRAAVKKLLLYKVYVNSNLIGDYLRHSYPVDSNIKTFNEELSKKLDCAVRVGLIIRHGENAYCLPTLRQDANRLKRAFAAFWEKYNVIMDFVIYLFMICLQSSIFINHLRSTINRVLHGTEGKATDDRVSKRAQGISTAAKVNDRNFHGEQCLCTLLVHPYSNTLNSCTRMYTI